METKNKMTLAGAFTLATFMVLSEVNAYADLTTTFTDATTQTKNIAKDVMQFLEVLVGLGAIVLLVMNFMKRKDGEQNSNDAIVGWVKGLVFTLIGLIVVDKVLLA